MESRATRRSQFPGHLTNKGDEDVACVPGCESLGGVIMSPAFEFDAMTYKESLCLMLNKDRFNLRWPLLAQVFELNSC